MRLLTSWYSFIAFSSEGETKYVFNSLALLCSLLSTRRSKRNWLILFNQRSENHCIELFQSVTYTLSCVLVKDGLSHTVRAHRPDVSHIHQVPTSVLHQWTCFVTFKNVRLSTEWVDNYRIFSRELTDLFSKTSIVKNWWI